MKALLKALFIKGLVQFGISTGLKSKAPKYILLKIAAGILFLIAGIFALIAVHQILLEHLDRPVVNLIFAAAFALLAAIILITVSIMRSRQKSKSPIDAPLRSLEQFGDQAQTQVKQLGQKAEIAIKRKPGKALLGVALLSMIVGWRTARRK